MASSSKPQLIKDGPQYSRMEKWDGQRTTWYANGTDPDADDDEPRPQPPNEPNMPNIPMEDPDSPPGAQGGASNSPPPGHEPELSSDPEEHLQHADIQVPGGASPAHGGSNQGEEMEPLVPGLEGGPDSREDSGHQSDPENAEAPRAASHGRVSHCDKFCRCLVSQTMFVSVFLVGLIFLGATLMLKIALIPDLKNSIEEMTQIRPSMSAAFKHPNENISMSIFLYNSSSAINGLGDVELSDMPLNYSFQSVKSGLTWNKNDTVSYRVHETAFPDITGNVTDKLDDILATDAQQLAVRIVISNRTSEVYNVYTGARNITDLNKVYAYNYDVVQAVKAKDGSKYYGTAEGDLFAPFPDKKETIAMFYREVNRNVLFSFQRETKVGDYDVYRYGLNSDSQIINVTDDPFVVSIPSDNIHPGYPACNQTIDIHQISGVTLRKSLCMEYSLPVQLNSSSHEKLIPVVRVHTLYDHTPFYMKQLMSSYHVYHLLIVSYYTCMVISCTCGVLWVGLVTLYSLRNRFMKS